jgi:hypothetical protein
MAGELVLSGIIARKRFGSAPISDTATPVTTHESIPVGLSLGQRSSRRTPSDRSVPEEASV